MKTKSTSPVAETVDMGSGNVFADLGLPDPDERQLRVQLAMRLNDLLQAEGLTQAAAAKRFGIAQPHVSELKNFKLGRFSSERLLHYITLLNRDVEIFIRPRSAPLVMPDSKSGTVIRQQPFGSMRPWPNRFRKPMARPYRLACKIKVH
jgi:predicted XRE-type DNA-binding protein